MAKRLYIGNLPLAMEQSELEQLVAALGEVADIRLVKDQYSGRSRGFAFVEMRRDDDAQKVIQELNDKEVQGRKLVVNEARPKESSGGRRPFGGSRPDRRGPPSGRRRSY
jgi:RNA recognition motif-containing protein